MKELYHTNSEEWVNNELAKIIVEDSKAAEKSITQQVKYNSTLPTPPAKHYIKESFKRGLKSLKKKLFREQIYLNNNINNNLQFYIFFC